MIDEGVVSINYDTKSRAVSVVYEPDTPYEIAQIIAYVEDMTEGRSMLITVYEGSTMMHRMRRISGEWSESAPS